MSGGRTIWSRRRLGRLGRYLANMGLIFGSWGLGEEGEECADHEVGEESCESLLGPAQQRQGPYPQPNVAVPLLSWPVPMFRSIGRATTQLVPCAKRAMNQLGR